MPSDAQNIRRIALPSYPACLEEDFCLTSVGLRSSPVSSMFGRRLFQNDGARAVGMHSYKHARSGTDIPGQSADIAIRPPPSITVLPMIQLLPGPDLQSSTLHRQSQSVSNFRLRNLFESTTPPIQFTGGCDPADNCHTNAFNLCFQVSHRLFHDQRTSESTNLIERGVR